MRSLSQVLAYKHFPLKFGGVFHAGVEVPWLMKSHSSNRPKLGQGIFQVNYVLVCSCMLLCYESFRWSESSATESRGQKVFAPGRWMPWNGASGSQRVSRLAERRKLCDLLLRESHDQSILLVVPHSQLSWLWLGWQRFMVTQGGSYYGVTPIADLGVSPWKPPYSNYLSLERFGSLTKPILSKCRWILREYREWFEDAWRSSKIWKQVGKRWS